ADRARNRNRSRGREGDTGSSKRKRKSESESNMSGTGDPSANLYSLDGKRIKTGFDSGNTNASSTPGPETKNPRGSPEKFEFDRLSLSPILLNGVKDLGYEKITLVLEATLPATLQVDIFHFVISKQLTTLVHNLSLSLGKDVLAKAKTGMEKTLAFLVLFDGKKKEMRNKNQTVGPILMY
ncbi:hypothetical protein Goshw_007112, partial [Gossypium schwendimanii]|nr:hypothetical protein [Gossypium schwendimanii]